MSKGKVAKLDGLTRLHELDAEEVSLVPQGAIGRRFLIAKSAGSDMDATKLKDMKEKIAKADPKTVQAVNERIKVYKTADDKPLSAEVKKALSVVSKILAPFADEIPADLAQQVLAASGVKIEKLGTPGKKPTSPTGQDPINKAEDDEGDSDEGDDVEKAAMEGKDPEGKVEKGDKDTEDDKCDGKGATAKSADDKPAGGKKPVGKQGEGERVSKSADDAATREKEAVAKQQKELVEKVADLQAQLKERDRKDREKELVQKAAGWNHLAIDTADVVEQLKLADAAGKDPFERVCKNFDRLNEAGRNSSLFSELGTSQSAGGANSPSAQLEQFVSGIVAKSSGMTNEQAYAKALESPEGRRLYAAAQAQRPGGI